MVARRYTTKPTLEPTRILSTRTKPAIQMNKWTITFLLISITTLSFAQKNKISVFELDQIRGLFYQRNTIGPFTGLAFEEFSNGKKKMHVPIEKGKINGLVKEWAKDGTQVYEATYVDGKKEGLEQQWYATKQKKVEVPYSNDLPNGVATEWHRNGKKKSEGLFRLGEENGVHLWWFDNEQLDQEATYIDGKEDGIVKGWYRTGQKEFEQHYKMGVKQGPTLKWYVNGQQKSEELFVNGKPDGEAKFWNDEGILHTIRIYENGQLIQEKNYRSGSINVGNGYVQVYNNPGAYIKVPVIGDGVRAIDSKNVIYAIDGQIVQLFNIDWNSFMDTINKDLKYIPVMKQYLTYEARNIKNREQNFQFDIQQEEFVTTNDIEGVHWHFETPGKYAEEQTRWTIQEEHFISLVCGNQILTLTSAVAKADDPEKILARLKQIANDVEVAEAPIDLNEIIAKLRG
jgi:antitoxin component YwqK of YwqJK toxin-antitoxin module